MSEEVGGVRQDAAESERGWLALARDSDIWHSFFASPVTVGSAVLTIIIFLAAIFAPLVAPYDPFDLASIDILDASLPPAWIEGGDVRFLLGTDDQGRDIFSTIIFGARISLLVGFASIIFAMILGVGLGVDQRLCRRASRRIHHARG